MTLLVKNGWLLDPASGQITQGDVVCRDGSIVAIGPDAAGAAQVAGDTVEVLDAAGMLVTPGLIDMHVHLREPGFEYKEEIATGARAAAIGGFTTIACMPNTSPVLDNAAMIAFVRDRAAQQAVVNVLPIGAVTKNLAGKEMAEIGDMVQAGAIGFSDDGKPVWNGEIMRNALLYASMYDRPILTHSEDPHLAEDGQMHLGAWSGVLGLRGIPAAAEAAMIARDCMLAELTKGKLHICHVSTELSLSAINWARSRGVEVTCEVTPHHLVLTDKLVGDSAYDTNTKVNPPLRATTDVEAMVEGLRSGAIEVIASDHAPHSFDDKDVEYNYAANGIIGLETTLPVVLTHLVHAGKVDLATVIRAMTLAPAKVLGLERKGRLAAGMDADLTVIDLDATSRIDPARFASKSRNTPFAGWEVKGLAMATVVAGKVVQRAGQVCV
jgi:dihydroorotase